MRESVVQSLASMVAANSAPTAEFAYIDESGNTGPTAKGGTRTFTLGCIMVPLDQWTDRLDALVETRREIKQIYGVGVWTELKANYLLRGRGPLFDLGLGDGQRRDIYQRVLGAANLISSGAFAVVVDKVSTPDKDPFDTAWTYLLQRLRIRSEVTGHPIIVVHDDGDQLRTRTIMRRFRRHSYAPNGRAVEARLLIEDPVPRDSDKSLFIQCADLAAFAAFRRVQPPTERAASVCNEKMWSTIAPIWATKVARRRNDAIVVYPS